MKHGTPRKFLYARILGSFAIQDEQKLVEGYTYIYIYKTFIIYVRPELGQPLECRSIKSIPERLGQPKTYQQVDSSQHQFVTKKAVLLTTVPRTTSLQKQGKMGVNNTLLGGMVNSARFAHLRKREGFRRKVPLTKQKESRYVFSSLASLYTT